jgi:hypothetical protein
VNDSSSRRRRRSPCLRCRERLHALPPSLRAMRLFRRSAEEDGRQAGGCRPWAMADQWPMAVVVSTWRSYTGRYTQYHFSINCNDFGSGHDVGSGLGGVSCIHPATAGLCGKHCTRYAVECVLFSIRADVRTSVAPPPPPPKTSTVGKIPCDSRGISPNPRAHTAVPRTRTRTGRGRQEGRARCSAKTPPHTRTRQRHGQGRTQWEAVAWPVVVRGGRIEKAPGWGLEHGSSRTATTTTTTTTIENPLLSLVRAPPWFQGEHLAVIRRILKAADRWSYPRDERRMLTPRPSVRRVVAFARRAFGREMFEREGDGVGSFFCERARGATLPISASPAPAHQINGSTRRARPSRPRAACRTRRSGAFSCRVRASINQSIDS